jgi:hypothetical protein
MVKVSANALLKAVQSIRWSRHDLLGCSGWLSLSGDRLSVTGFDGLAYYTVTFPVGAVGEACAGLHPAGLDRLVAALAQVRPEEVWLEFGKQLTVYLGAHTMRLATAEPGVEPSPVAKHQLVCNVDELVDAVEVASQVEGEGFSGILLDSFMGTLSVGSTDGFRVVLMELDADGDDAKFIIPHQAGRGVVNALRGKSGKANLYVGETFVKIEWKGGDTDVRITVRLVQTGYPNLVSIVGEVAKLQPVAGVELPAKELSRLMESAASFAKHANWVAWLELGEQSKIVVDAQVGKVEVGMGVSSEPARVAVRLDHLAELIAMAKRDNVSITVLDGGKLFVKSGFNYVLSALAT